MLRVRDYLADQKIMRSLDAPQSPTVSVILPTYARCASGRLKRAIDSVLSQTLTDFELIVVDDGSIDGTDEFVEECRAKDPRVVHVRHELNSGLPALRVNEGIELARGRFLAFQFDDDSWRPQALEALVRAAEHQKDPALIVGRCRARFSRERLIFPDRELSLPYLVEKNSIANNSVLFRRSLVEQHGMMDCHIAMRRVCDWDWWIRLARQAALVPIDEIVSEVEAELPDSIAVTAPYDLALARVFQCSRRDHLLQPDRWRDYEIDSLRAGEDVIEGKLGRRLYEDQIAPYYLKHRHHFPQVENCPTTSPARRKSVLCAEDVYHDPWNRAIELVAQPARRENPVAAARESEIIDEPRLPPRGHVFLSKSVQFFLVPRRQNWIGLDVLIGTHMQVANGRLHLRVRSPSGELLREASQELIQINDNDWAVFRFDPLPETATQIFIAEFALEKRDRITKISLYENQPLENPLLRILRRAGMHRVRHNLHCRMSYHV